MRHQRRGRKLGRTASHRRATLNNMATSLFDHGRVRTTLAKGKELRQVAERLITFAKRGDLHARRLVLRRIRNKVVVAKLFNEIASTFTERNGGYTRVLKLGARRGDATELCIVELVGDERRRDYASQAASRTERPRPAAAKAESAATDAPAEASGGAAAQARSEGEKSES